MTNTKAPYFRFPTNYVRDGLTVQVPITYLLKHTTASCDFDSIRSWRGLTAAEWWEMIIQNKAADSGFGHLVDAIMEHGFSEDSPIGWNTGEITEGHHRLVAAILLGLDTVPCSMWGGEIRRDGEWNDLVNAHYSEDFHGIQV